MTIIPEAKVGYSPWKHGSWLKFLSSPTCSATSTVTDDLERKVPKTWEFWRYIFPFKSWWCGNLLGIPRVWPPPNNSDHQDDYIFRLWDSLINLHVPLLLGGPHLRVTLDIPRLIMFGNNSPSLTKNDDFIILVLTPTPEFWHPLSIKVKTQILRVKSHHKNPYQVHPPFVGSLQGMCFHRAKGSRSSPPQDSGRLGNPLLVLFLELEVVPNVCLEFGSRKSRT